jgi:acyl-coenzyme A synthetase/AMP-(fatty) acid ligase
MCHVLLNLFFSFFIILVVRALIRYDAAPIANYDLSSLRVLGSVGEPINPEAWKWYFTHVGRGRCTVVDTYWQTETGGHIATNYPGKDIMNDHVYIYICV